MNVEHRPDFDLLLLNGEVLDGSGKPARRMDVGISGGSIKALGDLSAATAGQSLDCATLHIAPGFIDVHSHSDAYLLVESRAISKVHQGITTEVVGQCGTSAAPLVGRAELSAQWKLQSYPGEWGSFGEYRALLQRQGTAVNVVALAGHGKIRSAVMGFDARPATVDEVKAMSRLLEASLDEGAGGFSTGLIYEPGRHALPEEVEALVAVAGAHDGIYATHMRSEADQLLEAVDECIGAARKSGTALQISHLKTSGPQNWHKAEAAIRKIEDARQAGMRVYADRYPYTASGTTLTVVLPGWAREGGTVALAKRLADSAIRARMLREVQELRDEEYWSTVAIGATFHEETHLLRGRTLRAVGELWGCSPAEALLRVLELDEARTYAFYFSMCEENLHRFLEQPWLMICSDASCGGPTGPLSKGHPHPRSYGSHARALAMGRAGKPLALPEMVRRMTSLPAEAFGLKGRGRVAVGQCADIAVFDAERVCDRATYAQPHQLAEGMHHVIVNGVAVLEGGFITGRLPGHFLKPELG